MVSFIIQPLRLMPREHSLPARHVSVRRGAQPYLVSASSLGAPRNGTAGEPLKSLRAHQGCGGVPARLRSDRELINRLDHRGKRDVRLASRSDLAGTTDDAGLLGWLDLGRLRSAALQLRRTPVAPSRRSRVKAGLARARLHGTKRASRSGSSRRCHDIRSSRSVLSFRKAPGFSRPHAVRDRVSAVQPIKATMKQTV